MHNLLTDPIIRIMPDNCVSLTVCRERAKEAGAMQENVLRQALFVLANKGAPVDWRDKSKIAVLAKIVEPWLDAFDQAVDAIFFESAFQEVAADGGVA